MSDMPYVEAHEAVEARFICENQQVIDQTSSRVVLRASIQGRDNTDWAPYTPSGVIDWVVNGSAGAFFTQGKRYKVVITECPEG